MLRSLLLVVVLYFSPAHAASPTTQQILNEVSSELVECSAYFNILSVADENSNHLTRATGWKAIADHALDMALVGTEAAGLKVETVEARLRMYLKEMADRIGMNTSNISILMADYKDRCTEALNEPEKRLAYWQQRLSRP